MQWTEERGARSEERGARGEERRNQIQGVQWTGATAEANSGCAVEGRAADGRERRKLASNSGRAVGGRRKPAPKNQPTLLH